MITWPYVLKQNIMEGGRIWPRRVVYLLADREAENEGGREEEEEKEEEGRERERQREREGEDQGTYGLPSPGRPQLPKFTQPLEIPPPVG
jgi:hypothetical protein